MTLTHTQKTKKSGMTLIELTVVILVLLSLISILFVGARAWKRGSDRAGCIMNIRNVQQGVRSFQNMNGLTPGDAVAAATDVIGPGLFVEKTPVCPGRGTYAAFATTIPVVGDLFLECNLAADDDHIPVEYSDW